MAKIQAFSSVSVVDLTDVGVINFYLTSNQPNSVIYDPNSNGGSYSPSWATSNLRITPVISYNGTNLSLSAQGLVISYTRKEGNGTSTELTTGETVSNGILVVSADKLSTVSSGQLTYICNITYIDPDTGVPISSEASLSYSLISMATELKYAYIVGENTFLYDTSRQLVPKTRVSITLTADLKNCSVSQWKYKNSSGNFVAYPTTNNQSISGDTLVVMASDPDIWLNDKMAIIKLETEYNDIYDIIQINKIYDGAAGDSTVAAVLTNENHVVAADSEGNVKSWAGASTEIHIYEGGKDVTTDWNVTWQNGDGLTGSIGDGTYIYTPTALSTDSSYADFTCTKKGSNTGYAPINKRYTISKQYAGSDGEDAVIYEVTPSVYTLTLNESNVLQPSSVIFNAYTKKGEALVRENYSGRFRIFESTDGTTFGEAKYTSGSNEYTHSYTPTTNTVIAIKCVLYAAGGFTTQLDDQSVMITKDGKVGKDGLSMGLSNYSDVIPCDTSGKALDARVINIPFYCYKGIQKTAVTASVTTSPLPDGFSIKSNTAGSTSKDGLIELQIAKGGTLGGASMTGDITIRLTSEGKSSDFKYTWTKSKQAAAGVNAILLRLFSEDGGTVDVNKSTTIKAILNSGTSEIDPQDITWTWAAYKNGGYQTIDNQTSNQITITSDMVTDQMWLRCSAKYPKTSTDTYNEYYTVDDTTDPLTAYTYSTIREFKNGQGYAAIYTRIYRDKEEVDPIKSTTFSNTAPSAPQNGDYYYQLDTSNSANKKWVLKKYNGSKWVNATDAENNGSYIYSYYRLNNAGESLDNSEPWKQGRVQYIDPTIIEGRMQFICEVSEPEESESGT